MESVKIFYTADQLTGFFMMRTFTESYFRMKVKVFESLRHWPLQYFVCKGTIRNFFANLFLLFI